MFRRRPQVPVLVEQIDHDEGIQLVATVLNRMSQANHYRDVVLAALNAMCDAVGWDFACAWRINEDNNVLTFFSDCGRMPPEAVESLASVAHRKGEGIPGKVWATGQLLLVADLRQVSHHSPVVAAVAAKFTSSLGLPLTEQGQIVGVMQFVSRGPWSATPARLELMRMIGVIVSQALERVAVAEAAWEQAHDMAAVNTVLKKVTDAGSQDAAIQVTLDTIRQEFGWEYGSFWAVDENDRDASELLGVRQCRGGVSSGDARGDLPRGRRRRRSCLEESGSGLRSRPRPGD